MVGRARRGKRRGMRSLTVPEVRPRTLPEDLPAPDTCVTDSLPRRYTVEHMQARTMRRTGPAVWQGTEQETVDLLAAAASHCTCVVDDRGLRVIPCGPHAMLATDQRALDGLLFARHMHARLR